MDFFLILAIGLVAGTLGGLVGFGSSIMLMPVLVIVFGPLQAVPIMAIAAIMANLSRIIVWWREVDWHTCSAYSVTAMPAAALGAATLLVLPTHVIEIALGTFFIAMIFVRRWMAARDIRFRLHARAAAGRARRRLTGVGFPPARSPRRIPRRRAGEGRISFPRGGSVSRRVLRRWRCSAASARCPTIVVKA